MKPSIWHRLELAYKTGREAFRASSQPSDEPEHPLLAESRQFIRRPIAAFLIAFGGTFIGLWLALRVEAIKDATGQAIENVWGRQLSGPAWEGLLFWVLCIAWAWLLKARLNDEDTVVVERTRSLVRAIHKTANLKVVKNYTRGFFYPILNDLGPINAKEPLGSAEQIAQRIRNALARIARFAQEFANNPEASYGANVMLVAQRDDFDTLRDALRFVVDPRDTASLLAILYLPKDLVIRNFEEKRARAYPLIALPVPESIKSPSGTRRALPGAPSALLGEPSVQMDTRTIARECGDLDQQVVQQIEQYFGNAGEGKDVRSFASFRLGTGKNPVGVFNVDCDRVCVLGESEEYYITFFALLEPLLAALALQVQEFAALTGRPQRAS